MYKQCFDATLLSNTGLLTKTSVNPVTIQLYQLQV